MTTCELVLTIKHSDVERLLSTLWCARGMIHNKIHVICPGCLRPSIALTVQKRGLKHHSFIHSFIHSTLWTESIEVMTIASLINHVFLLLHDIIFSPASAYMIELNITDRSCHTSGYRSQHVCRVQFLILQHNNLNHGRRFYICLIRWYVLLSIFHDTVIYISITLYMH